MSSSAINPDASSVPVPLMWRWLRKQVARQGTEDYACGLYAVLTAARYLMPTWTGTGTGLLARLEKLHGLEARTCIERGFWNEGIFEDDVLALASVAGLKYEESNPREIEQFYDTPRDRPWIALVRVLLPAWRGGPRCYRYTHYVLVVGYVEAQDVFVIADSHPWTEPVYCVNSADFDAAWCAATKGHARWAAQLRAKKTP